MDPAAPCAKDLPPFPIFDTFFLVFLISSYLYIVLLLLLLLSYTCYYYSLGEPHPPPPRFSYFLFRKTQQKKNQPLNPVFLDTQKQKSWSLLPCLLVQHFFVSLDLENKPKTTIKTFQSNPPPPRLPSLLSFFTVFFCSMVNGWILIV